MMLEFQSFLVLRGKEIRILKNMTNMKKSYQKRQGIERIKNKIKAAGERKLGST